MPWTALTATASDPSTTKDSLFQACTAIHLGNGERVRFWGDNWLAGAWPKDIAPDLFALAWRKRLTVATALRDARWDAWPSSHINNGADRAVRAPLVLASGCAPGGPARRHSVAVHGNWYLLHQISLSSAISWFVRGLRVGAAMVGEGGEQVQSLRLVASVKQVVDI
jgi:hypothetical protein